MLKYLLVPYEITHIKSMLTKGLTPVAYNQIAGFMAGQGFGWATAVGAFRRDIMGMDSLLFAKSWLRPYKAHRQKVLMERLGKETPIQQKDYVEHELNQATKYMYTAQCDLMDEDGFVYSTRHFSYYSDEPYTPEEAMDAAEEVFTEDYGEEALGAANFQFINAFHNVGWTY